MRKFVFEMQICIVHNEYGRFSGEEAIVERICRLLEGHGHKLIRLTRSSSEIPALVLGEIRAFFSGIYSFASARRIRRILQEQRPDVVHVHNLFPLISPSVLQQCRKAGVPVVMTVHNYRLVCPNGLHMKDGQVCEKCAGGREYWCVLKNCEGSLFKSLGYALRNFTARKWRLFLDNVTVYTTLTEFQRQRLIAEGFPGERIVVIPNMSTQSAHNGMPLLGDYVGYVGRISPEKMVPLLLEAARRIRNAVFRAAGDWSQMPEIRRLAPSNFQFLGHLSGEDLEEFYRSSRFLVLCSSCFEGFPVTLAEAMQYGKPVISSRIGGLPEIVDDGVTGLLFESGNVDDLADKIGRLWSDPELCRRMGLAGREKALREYSSARYYERLIHVYARAMRLRRH